MFPSLTLAAASPTCPSPAPEPGVYLCGRMVVEVGADKLERGRESREKEKLHTSRAGSFWQSELAAPAPLSKVDTNAEARGE